jgi:hypothetical protein
MAICKGSVMNTREALYRRLKQTATHLIDGRALHVTTAINTWIEAGHGIKSSQSRGNPKITPVGVFISDGEPAAESRTNGQLVAPDGAWVHEGSAEFFAVLGDPDPDYDAPLFAVKNLGFISVRVSRRVVDITLHPRNVSAAALRSVENVIWFLSPDFFRVRYLREDWISETLSSSALTLSRLGEICAEATIRKSGAAGHA